MKRLLLVLLLGWATGLAAQAQPTTVILVRHAEKAAAPADNPPLTVEGQARVARLTDLLRDAGITAIYSTPYVRTRETARGVANRTGLQITETPIPRGGVTLYADSVAARVRREGGVILVVGHSNTLGPVIKALGGPEIDEITDPEHDNLFVVTVQEGKPTRLIRSRYK